MLSLDSSRSCECSCCCSPTRFLFVAVVHFLLPLLLPILLSLLSGSSFWQPLKTEANQFLFARCRKYKILLQTITTVKALQYWYQKKKMLVLFFSIIVSPNSRKKVLIKTPNISGCSHFTCLRTPQSIRCANYSP